MQMLYVCFKWTKPFAYDSQGFRFDSATRLMTSIVGVIPGLDLLATICM